MRVHGQCHCGNIAYEAEVDPARAQICHCTDCQTLSGSPYRVSVPAAEKDLTFTRGKPKIYLKTTADSGRKRAQGFCGDCGTPLYAAPGEPGEQIVYFLRTGAITERVHLPPRRAIWCESLIPWADDISALPKVRGQ